MSTVLLLNATNSQIATVTVNAGQSLAPAIAAMTAFPAMQAQGSATLPGCSFQVPVATTFTLTVAFDTGEQASISTMTHSSASPALYFVAFLNGVVVAKPDGTAADISFSRSGTFASSSGARS